MNQVCAEFTYTEIDAMRAHDAFTRAQRGLRFMNLLLPLIGFSWVAFAVYGAILQGSPLWQLGFWGYVGIVVASVPLFLRFAVKRAFRKNPQAGKIIRWEFDHDRVSYRTDVATGVFEWKKFVRVKAVKHGILLFFHPNAAEWIPWHAFAGQTDIESLRRFVEGNGLKYEG